MAGINVCLRSCECTGYGTRACPNCAAWVSGDRL